MSTFTRIASSFHNMRGSMKLGPVDAGTHSGLVQRKNGGYLLLDALTMQPDVLQQVKDATNGGKDIEVTCCCVCWLRERESAGHASKATTGTLSDYARPVIWERGAALRAWTRGGG